jgi:hypothetical protein
MAALEPFVRRLFKLEPNNAVSSIEGTTEPVPAGKLWVVEHISGFVAIKNNHSLEGIWAATIGERGIWLPKLLESDPRNFGDQIGIARSHSFGSPARMYIDPGRNVKVRADASPAVMIEAWVIGYLVTV